MRWRLRISLGTAALALGCPHGGPDAGGPSPSSSPVLVSYRLTETMQGGMGGTTGTITAREDGTVTVEREVDGERRTFDCPPLDEAALGELAGLVQVARDAGLEARYDRSSLPEPQANYSRTRTVVLGAGSPIEVVIDGWADEPPELAAVEQRVEASAAGCTEMETTASGEGCYRSDPANVYSGTRRWRSSRATLLSWSSGASCWSTRAGRGGTRAGWGGARCFASRTTHMRRSRR